MVAVVDSFSLEQNLCAEKNIRSDEWAQPSLQEI
jgi:hypothetical protein